MDTIDIGQYRALIAAGTIPKIKKKRAPEEDLHRACVEWVVISSARYPILRKRSTPPRCRGCVGGCMNCCGWK